MSDYKEPKKGETCPAMTNEDCDTCPKTCNL